MELTIKTSVLQDMVGKAIKCSSNNKLIPITSLMNVKVKDGVLYITTTDATNYFYVKTAEKVNCEDFEISAIADTFTKLVQKTTSENITLTYSDDKVLKVNGNGNYTIELPLDENGNVIKFPKEPEFRLSKPLGTLKSDAIQAALDYNKASLSASQSYPALTCYYCGDTIITSNQIKICSSNVKSFDEPVLISATLMEILGVMSDNIEVMEQDNKLVFTTALECVVSNGIPNISEFPLAPITRLLETAFDSNCSVSKTAVLNVLDRLSLFMSNYDNKGIDLTVTREGVTLSTQASSGIEVVPFITSENFKDYHCRINIEILKEQLSTHSEDEVQLYYGDSKTIKLVSKNISQIIALMDEG